MHDLRPIMAFFAMGPLLSGCETLLESHRRIYVPIDETVWTADLAEPAAPASVDVTGTGNARRAVVQFSEYSWVYLHFYPTPLEIIRETLVAYGTKIVINDFKMALNPAYKGSQFAITLQYELQLEGQIERITAIGTRKLENKHDRREYQAAMQDAIDRAVAESRVAVENLLDGRE